MSETEETRMFNMNWQNDYNVYHAVLGLARDLLRANPELPDRVLGSQVRDTLREWCEVAQGESNPLAIMRKDVGDFDRVDVLSVAEDVRYGLGVEE